MSNKAIIRALLILFALRLSAAAQPQTITGKVVGVSDGGAGNPGDHGQHADGDIHRYVLHVVYPCVCSRELAGRRAESILDRHRLFDVPACKI
jgi:hypothetical protein